MARATTVETIKEQLAPAFEAYDETVRQGGRAIVRGRHAAEDAVDAAVVRIKRRPLGTVLTGAGIGALAGCVIGFAVGCAARCRR